MERYVFPNVGRAEAALANMKKLIEWYGIASRADMMDIHGSTPTPEDQKFGWNDLSNTTIENNLIDHEAVLILPRAVRID